MKVNKIPTLESFNDWLKKAKSEYERYSETKGVYDFANCFLTLNALPEWIEKSDHASPRLKQLAEDKINIMKGDNNRFILDESKLDDIDQQLRLVRVFCNHSKHGDKKNKIPKITMSTPFPTTFPVVFDHLRVGQKNVPVDPILKSIISFWEHEISNA